MKTVLKLTLSAVLTTLLGANLAWASDDKEDAVEYRRGVYEVIKWNFVPMAGMVKGELEYNADEFAMRAERIAALSKMPLEGFIEGTDLLSMGAEKTEAKPDIWEQWDTFKEKMSSFEAEAAKLAEVAKTGDLAQIKPQFGETGKNCKSCHDEFRAD